MFPGTGSSGLDAVLEIVLLGVLVATIVLMVRNFRGR
jgi:hypothetical protein